MAVTRAYRPTAATCWRSGATPARPRPTARKPTSPASSRPGSAMRSAVATSTGRRPRSTTARNTRPRPAPPARSTCSSTSATTTVRRCPPGRWPARCRPATMLRAGARTAKATGRPPLPARAAGAEAPRHPLGPGCALSPLPPIGMTIGWFDLQPVPGHLAAARSAPIPGFRMARPRLFRPRSAAIHFLAGLALVASATAWAGPAGLAWSPVAAGEGAPTARHENAFVAVDGRLYLLGGRDQRPLDIFDPATGRWQRGAAPPLEIHHFQAVAHEGRLYVLGAFTGGFPDEQPLTHVLVYDPATDRWSQGAEVPAQRRRGAAGVVSHGGRIYLVGGNTRGHMSGFVPWLDAFDPATGQWEPLADAPHARDHFHAAVLDGRLYAAGGRRTSHDTGDTLSLTIPHVDVYDFAAARWTTLDAPLPTPRAGAGA